EQPVFSRNNSITPLSSRSFKKQLDPSPIFSLFQETTRSLSYLLAPSKNKPDIDISRWLESLSEHLQINLSSLSTLSLSLSQSMVAFLLAPSVSSSSCDVAASSALPDTMPGWQPSAVDWSLWIKREVIEDDLLDLSSPLLPVATVDPALTVLPAVSVSPSAPVLCSSFSPRPMDD
ncbi:hypothetical protein, partial, partial [Absidia glauca]